MSLRRPCSLRVLLRTVIALAVTAAIATAAVAATSSHGTTYRTALVTVADVSAELDVTGTIQPVSQATIAFPISGTVATVPVKVGQSVQTGQTLATLAPTSLQAAVTKAEASLASAELALHQVLNGERVSGGGNGGNGSSPTGSDQSNASARDASAAAAASVPSNGASGGNDTAVARAAVQQAQARVARTIAAANQALNAATKACASDPTPPTTTPSTTTSTTAPANPSSDCAAAQATVMRDLESVATAERTLASAESRLAALLASSNPQTPSTTPTSSPSTTVDYTDTQIASYEAAVTAAAAKVAAAQQDLAQATIVSPIRGTVAAVGLSPGTSVSAASSTANVVVVGDGGYEVTTAVTIADRAKLKVGDTATVVADGSAKQWNGRVVRIGVVESTSNNTSTYSVVIGFTGTPTGLRNGASAAVTIVTARTEHALTVPTSAIQTVGNFHTVTVVDHGKTMVTRVEIGTVGAQRTVMTSGLKAGQAVSLADVGAAIPPSGSSNNNGGAFTNGLGGGGNGPTFRRLGN